MSGTLPSTEKGVITRLTVMPDGTRVLRLLREQDGRAFAMDFVTLQWEDVGRSDGLFSLNLSHSLKVTP